MHGPSGSGLSCITAVAIDAAQGGESRACLGCSAINAHAIGVADMPSDAAPPPPCLNLTPGVFLDHLAIDGSQQGQGLGRILLVDAMKHGQRGWMRPGWMLHGWRQPSCWRCTLSCLGQVKDDPAAMKHSVARR
jgi:hypothetical protein